MSTNQCKLLLNMADVLVDSCVAKWVSAEHWATNKQTIVFQINLVFLQISLSYVTHLYQSRALSTWCVYSFHSHRHKWFSYYLPTNPMLGSNFHIFLDYILRLYAYHIYVIFFTRAKFFENKIYTKKCVNYE